MPPLLTIDSNSAPLLTIDEYSAPLLTIDPYSAVSLPQAVLGNAGVVPEVPLSDAFNEQFHVGLVG